MARKQNPAAEREALTFEFTLTPEQEEALVKRVAERLRDGRDDGFLDAKAAGQFLGGMSAKAVYQLAQRGWIRPHRLGSRVLFDPAELREDVECGR
jgi:hypothetical protein